MAQEITPENFQAFVEMLRKSLAQIGDCLNHIGLTLQQTVADLEDVIRNIQETPTIKEIQNDSSI